MNVVIRTDASIKIGSGHVMRCLTLARQLKRHNINVTFICRDVEGNYIDFLKQEGIEVVTLSNSKDLKSDAFETIHNVKRIGVVHLLIVDHYGIDEKWEVMLRPYVDKIMVIDDLANRKHDCDLLLDQNYYENLNDRYSNLVPSNCSLLLGPKYVLLRDEFLKRNLRERTGKIKNILIFFGGTDPTDETTKAIKALEHLDEDFYIVDVIVGATNPNGDPIKKLCDSLPNFNYYCQVHNMADFMKRADLMIGAGGAITWERCLLQLPSITVTIAENQIETTKLLHELRVTEYIGQSKNVTQSHIKKSVIQLLNDKQKVKQMSEASGEIVNIEEVRNLPVVKAILRLLGVPL